MQANNLTEEAFVTKMSNNAGNLSLTKCVGYDKLLFHERYMFSNNAGEVLVAEWLKRLRLLLGNTSPLFVVVSEGPCKQQLEMNLNKPK